MPVSPGQNLAHYRLIEKIGEGGMGVVWKAEDTVLNRAVAIKVLPAESRDESRRKMFLEEAKAASLVSDARIVQVYEFGHEGDLDYIVMEYVEGQPLSKVLRGAPLSPDKVADIGLQVARALTKAHRNGLLHRDLKPANILITPDGEAKVVDFGLATLFTRRDTTLATDVRADATTQTVPRDQQRGIAGTLAYMSPEQTRGEKLDSRSDIFSLGVVLYEMTTGQRPFIGVTSAEVVAEIQKSRPRPVHELVPQVPLDLNRTIQKAMASKPGERYQHMDDLAVDLKRLGRELESGSSPSYEDLARSTVKKTRWALVTAGALLAVAVIAVAVLLRPTAQQTVGPTAVHRQITFTGTARGGEISRDGQFVAYVEPVEIEGGSTESRLLVQDLGGGEPLEIFRADFIPYGHRWSPDGTELLVTARRDKEWSTYLLPRLGGAERRLPSWGNYVSWSPDGRRIVWGSQPSKELWLVNKDTGEKASSVPLEDQFTFLVRVDWSPSGNYLAFLTRDEDDRGAIWTIPPEGGTQKKVIEEMGPISDIRWSGDGTSIYYLKAAQATRDLYKVGIDSGTGEAVAAPTSILTGLDMSSISVSDDRTTLVYTKRISDYDLWLFNAHERVDGKQVKPERLHATTLDEDSPSISPDGRQVVFVRGTDIYILPLGGGPARQLTFSDSEKWSLAWSPDGAWIAFGSNEGGEPKVWRIPAGGGTPRPFTKTKVSSTVDHALTWAPGDQILYQRPGNRQFHLLDPNTEEERPLIKDESVGWAFSPRYSPNGSLVAVSWNRKQPEGHYKQNLWIISLSDSTEVRIHDEYVWPLGWSPDGRWVYAEESASGRTIGVRVPATGGEAETVFDWPFEKHSGSCWPGPDDTRWVCSAGETSSDIWLVENFDPHVQ